MNTNEPDPSRILIVRPSALGDVARSICLATSIKKAHPHCKVDWLVQDGFEAVLEASPHIDRIIKFDRRGLSLKNAIQDAGWLPRLARLVRSLRAEHYDAVIDAQGLIRSAIFTRLTRTQIRVGYDKPPEPVRAFYSHHSTIDPGAHTVDRMLGLLECISIKADADLTLTVPEYAAEEFKAAHGSWHKQCNAGTNRLLVCAPTARWGSKRWPSSSWADLLEQLSIAQPDLQILIIGAPGEEHQCKEIIELAESTARIHNGIGTLSIAGTMHAISLADLVVASDSAPLHIAVGLKRPIIALFGPTEPTLVGPYGLNDCVIRPPGLPKKNTHRELREDNSIMRRILVSDVQSACEQKLAQGSTRPDRTMQATHQESTA